MAKLREIPGSFTQVSKKFWGRKAKEEEVQIGWMREDEKGEYFHVLYMLPDEVAKALKVHKGTKTGKIRLSDPENVYELFGQKSAKVAGNIILMWYDEDNQEDAKMSIPIRVITAVSDLEATKRGRKAKVVEEEEEVVEVTAKRPRRATAPVEASAEHRTATRRRKAVEEPVVEAAAPVRTKKVSKATSIEALLTPKATKAPRKSQKADLSSLAGILKV